MARTIRIDLTRSATLACPTGRFLHVQVWREPSGDGGLLVAWHPVVGFLTTVVHEYVKTVYGEAFPHMGVDRRDMQDKGWHSEGPPHVKVRPVIACSYTDEVGVLEVVEEDLGDNPHLLHEALLRCDWPPEQDRTQAVQAARELLAGTYSMRMCSGLDEPQPDPEEDPPHGG